MHSPALKVLREVTQLSSQRLHLQLVELTRWCPSGDAAGARSVDDCLSRLASDKALTTRASVIIEQIKDSVLLSDSAINRADTVRPRLQSDLKSSTTGPSVDIGGSVVLGLNSSSEIDVLVGFSDTDQFETDCLTAQRAIAHRIAELENALKAENHLDSVIACLHQCISDQKQAVKELLRLNSMQYSQADNTDRVKLIARLAADSDGLCRSGERFIEGMVNDFSARRKHSETKDMLDTLHFLRTQSHEIAMSIETAKTQSLMNLAANLGSLGYKGVQIQKRSRNPVVTFDMGLLDQDASVDTVVHCCAIINCPSYPLGTRLIHACYSLDSSGKLRLLAGFVLGYARGQGLVRELSSYAWHLLILHYLLRFGFIPDLQASEIEASSKGKSGTINVTSIESASLPQSCVDLIARTSLIELLISFYRYLGYQSDVYGSVFTLRGRGLVLPKSGWAQSKPSLWRLCLEDPLSGTDDLGADLNMDAQTKLFKFVRIACHALSALVSLPESDLCLFDPSVLFEANNERLTELASAGGLSLTATESPLTSSFAVSAVSQSPAIGSHDLDAMISRAASTTSHFSGSPSREAIGLNAHPSAPLDRERTGISSISYASPRGNDSALLAQGRPIGAMPQTSQFPGTGFSSLLGPPGLVAPGHPYWPSEDNHHSPNRNPGSRVAPHGEGKVSWGESFLTQHQGSRSLPAGPGFESLFNFDQAKPASSLPVAANEPPRTQYPLSMLPGAYSASSAAPGADYLTSLSGSLTGGGGGESLYAAGHSPWSK